jgi:hypothetical protein
LYWAGDPIEVKGRFNPGHGERTYEEMLAHFDEYTDTVGDHPLNLGTTTLALASLTGEEKYRNWILVLDDGPGISKVDATQPLVGFPRGQR